MVTDTPEPVDPEPINEPTSKAPAIDLVISGMTGKSREQQIAAGLCMTCPGEAKVFKTDLDRSEYRISGMCQECQDKVFGG
jgi:hypothetical protein